ncbi:branched-chain amino acid ABC transporter substrate-binding protein [Undibacterium sp. TJN25]|uniref:branched-chain amino acid ABC transporter substrate-binding protein n=1 Tax=Undibacterium sp. TJN25 TaxID=3413056 RepID=UPI003BF2FF36
MNYHLRPALLALTVAGLFYSGAASAEKIRIAYIDPLSGPFAVTGNNVLKSWQAIAELANKEKWAGDNTFEIVGFDNKGSPQETLTALKTVTDQGFRYIAQGFGSGAGLALIDAINKHNQRNPGKEVIYMNTSAGDPDMTNSKCSFYHFRLDANVDMRIEALTSFIEKDKSIKKLYLINPNYAFGQQVSRSAKESLKAKRPDIQIVGDDLPPFGQVKDYSPYIAKIAASGADTVITGNAGSDLSMLIKSSKEANLRSTFYTFFASSPGIAGAIGSAGEDRVKSIPYWHPNNETFSGKEIVESFKKKYNDDYFSSATYTGIALLAKAMKESKSTDPIKVAFAMEGMKVNSLNGEVEMRKADHQLQQPLYMVTWVKVNGKDVKYDEESTGYGWRTDRKIEAAAVTLPTTCQMVRPARS